MKKLKYILAAAFMVVCVAGATLPLGLTKVSAGSSMSYIISTSSIGETINEGDFSITGKVTADNGKAIFNAQSPKQKLRTKNKAFNMKEYGVETLLDFVSTFKFSSFGENGRFSLAFALNNSGAETGSDDSFAIIFGYDSAKNKIKIAIQEYLVGGTVVDVYPEAVFGTIKINREVTVKVHVDTDGKLTVSLKPQDDSEVPVVSKRQLTINPEGYIAYISEGGNDVTLSKPSILVYKYDAPENVDYVEDFNNGAYNANVLYSGCETSAIPPSSLSVENGALVFKNTANAYVSTRYKYSNFELCFDITDLQREVLKDDDGKIISYISSWFAIGFGVNSMDESAGTTTWYGTFLLFGFRYDDSYDKECETFYTLQNNNGSFNVLKSQSMKDFNIWSPEFKDEIINVKFTMTDGNIALYYKMDGDENWGEPYFTYDFGRVKTGYVRIFTADGDSESAKGLEYTAISNLTIDNFSIKNTDFEGVKKTLPTPEYKSNIWEKTPDYDYKTKPDANDLIANKITNGNLGGGKGNDNENCSASVFGTGVSLIVLAAVPFIKRKRK